MKRLGTVLHLSPHGHLIIRLEETSLPRMNAKVVTKKMDRVGTVYDIFGPEKAPYVSVKLDKKMPKASVQALVNERVFVA
ncbi:H/ACA ribonucleoprotein complex subunit GAR1 [Methanocella sp. MCL-LM]|uniref:H/ACA ribonucleoprotein complex subunit GAR1 n=1 Tax=Methanocella sp. MCL-LM TaxID=3412035 RepID=UPI003C777AE2